MGPGFTAEASVYRTIYSYVSAHRLVGDSGIVALLQCGALGQACCRAPEASQNIPAFGPIVSCQTGLGCDIDTGRCVSPCGGAGQPCCDGPETRATKWTAD